MSWSDFEDERGETKADHTPCAECQGWHQVGTPCEPDICAAEGCSNEATEAGDFMYCDGCHAEVEAQAKFYGAAYRAEKDREGEPTRPTLESMTDAAEMRRERGL